MKKNVTLVALIVCVILIWGLIGVRVWKMTRPEEVSRPIGEIEEKKVQGEALDTLLLNYRDPFLERRAVIHKESVQEITKPAPESSAPQVLFKGLMRGKDGKDLALIMVDNEWRMLTLGEQVQDARILEIKPKHVVLDWRGKRLIVEAQ